MRTSIFFESFCITFAVLMFMACGGGGGGDGGSSSPPPSPNISLSESSYNFSGVVNNKTADHTFEITNTGNANLAVGQITVLAAPYSIPVASDGCSNRTLGPSGTCTFRARFSPTVQGVFADKVSIPSNDPDGTATIGLSGEGSGLNVWIKNASAVVAGCVVTVGVTVTDDAGKILDNVDLDPNSDFSFEVDGIAVAPEDVTFDNYETPSPVSVVLAIDCSGSEAGVLPEIKNAATSFINQLNDADEAAICKFDSSIEFNPEPDATFHDLATQRQALIDYIATFTAGSSTRLYDAMYESIARADQGIITNKHLVVVLSDGVDAVSQDHALNDVINYSGQEGVPVFTIYYRDPNYSSGDYGDPDTLKQLADGTDGQDYDGLTGDLTDVYYKIASSIRNKFIFELTLPPGCASGDTVSLNVVAGGPHPAPFGEDSTTVTFP